MTDDRCDLLCLDLDKAERLRAELLDVATAEQLARRAKALGDPTRLTMAIALAGTNELCVCDLSWVVGRAENLVSHHLRALRAEGLVYSRREGKRRGEGCACTTDPLGGPADLAACNDDCSAAGKP